MRFLILLVLTIILLKLFLPELASPAIEILQRLLTILGEFLKQLTGSIPGI